MHDAALQQEKEVFLRPRTRLMVGEIPCVGQHRSAADDCAEECDPQDEGDTGGALEIVNALGTVRFELGLSLPCSGQQP